MYEEIQEGWGMVFDVLNAPGVLREAFFRSEYSSPEDIRPEIANFEKSARTLRARLIGPEDGLWTLEFTDLEREVRPATGDFEKYYFNVKPIFDGRLWDVRSNVSRQIFRKTMDRLVSFSSKLEHAFIPPKFIEELSADSEVNRVLAFAACRDYFTVQVSANPGIRVAEDVADLALKSTNAGHDYEVLVKKERPVGPLLLHSMDLVMKRKENECRVRIATDGFLAQIGRGERDLYLHMRNRIVQFFEEQDGWVKFMPTVEPEEKEDAAHALKFRSKRVVQFGKTFLLTFGFELNKMHLLKLKGLFTSNFHRSQFIGTVENEVAEKSFIVRTSDLRGGGDAIVTAEVGSSTSSIVPLISSKIRTLERIYKVVQEKFDVDAVLVPPKT